MFRKLLELHGCGEYNLDNKNDLGEANFYRRRRNHKKRDDENLDGRIKPSFIRIVVDDENTPIIVSTEAVFAFFTFIIAIVNNIEKPNIAISVLSIPSITPTAIPVNAEWPNASEKNAILLFTTIVPNIPNIGVTRSTPSKAFFIKSYCAH